MNEDHPLISVVIPAYNAGDYLRPALLSVLEQTYSNLEVFLIDDGSTDRSLESIADIGDRRLRVLRQPNRGKASALNRALDELGGDFYAIQDADDRSHPQRVERQVRCLLAHPELAGCLVGHELLLDDRRVAPRIRGKRPAECAEDIARFVMPAHDPTAMLRVKLVREYRFDPHLAIGQGYDYILRVGERHPLMVLPECLYSYRVRSGSNTRFDPGRREEFVRRIRESACRRRGLDPETVLATRSHRAQGRRADDNNLGAHFMESVLDLCRAGRRAEALRTGLLAARLRPLDPHYYKALVCALAPRPLIERARGLRSRSGLA